MERGYCSEVGTYSCSVGGRRVGGMEGGREGGREGKGEGGKEGGGRLCLVWNHFM